VSNITPYETLIAQKAEQLVVPDMADSVWASIEQQMDGGISPDEGNDPSGNPTPPKGLTGLGKGLYLFATMAVAGTSFFILTNKEKHPQESVPEQRIIQPVQPNTSTQDSNHQTTASPVDKKITPSLPKVVQPNSTNTINIPDIVPLNADSLTSIITPFVIPDTMTAKKDNLPPAIDSTTTNPPPGKKTKGVKGISNDDYKIPGMKNDPAKKKN
jgi:hypothetical protein